MRGRGSSRPIAEPRLLPMPMPVRNTARMSARALSRVREVVPYIFAGASLMRPGLLDGSPDGPFSLYIRAYWADKAILDGVWQPPVVVTVK